MQDYRTFAYKDTNIRYLAADAESVTREIVRQRDLLDLYIAGYPGFATALTPLPVRAGAPLIAREMHLASETVGVGPMAAVAGSMAEFAVHAALKAAREPLPAPEFPLDAVSREKELPGPGAVVENGGDMFIAAMQKIIVGLYAGKSSISGKIGFAVSPKLMPLALCSSSGTMGHSLSFGKADLATVAASSGALADAAATYACNLVQKPGDIEGVLDKVCSLPGILGVLIVLGEKIGMKGDLPPLVRISDPGFSAKITRDKHNNFHSA